MRVKWEGGGCRGVGDGGSGPPPLGGGGHRKNVKLFAGSEKKRMFGHSDYTVPTAT